MAPQASPTSLACQRVLTERLTSCCGKRTVRRFRRPTSTSSTSRRSLTQSRSRMISSRFPRNARRTSPTGQARCCTTRRSRKAAARMIKQKWLPALSHRSEQLPRKTPQRNWRRLGASQSRTIASSAAPRKTSSYQAVAQQAWTQPLPSYRRFRAATPRK